MFSKLQRPRGNFIESGPSGDVVTPTFQCVHGGEHFTIERGSGIKRGFCHRCVGPTCGSEACDRCLPFADLLELQERGKVRVSLGRGVSRTVSAKDRLV